MFQTGMGGGSYEQDFSVSSAENEAEDYEVLGTTVTSSNHLWVDPSIVKLSHRIGRGPFGDVWLATIHSSTKDFDEFHEVVVKMLPDAHEHIHSLLQKFQSTYQHVEAVRGVCWPQGITIKNGREDEKEKLIQETGLELKEVNNWFLNQRKRNGHSNPAVSSSSELKSKQKSW